MFPIKYLSIPTLTNRISSLFSLCHSLVWHTINFLEKANIYLQLGVTYTNFNLGMPPFILIICLLIAGTFFAQVFVLIPLNFLRSFSVPGGVFLALLALVVVWCFGET